MDEFCFVYHVRVFEGREMLASFHVICDAAAKGWNEAQAICLADARERAEAWWSFLGGSGEVKDIVLDGELFG